MCGVFHARRTHLSGGFVVRHHYLQRPSDENRQKEKSVNVVANRIISICPTVDFALR